MSSSLFSSKVVCLKKKLLKKHDRIKRAIEVCLFEEEKENNVLGT